MQALRHPHDTMRQRLPEGAIQVISSPNRMRYERLEAGANLSFQRPSSGTPRNFIAQRLFERSVVYWETRAPNSGERTTLPTKFWTAGMNACAV